LEERGKKTTLGVKYLFAVEVHLRRERGGEAGNTQSTCHHLKKKSLGNLSTSRMGRPEGRGKGLKLTKRGTLPFRFEAR